MRHLQAVIVCGLKLLSRIDVYEKENFTCERKKDPNMYLCILVEMFQGRQKLARFSAREFATLIIDILKEARRRQQGTMSLNRGLEKG